MCPRERSSSKTARDLLRTPAILLTAVVAVATGSGLVSSSARDELAMSLARQPTPYLQLAFTYPDVAVSCESDDGVLDLDVDITSHVSDARRLRWSVVTTARGMRSGQARQSRQVDRRTGVVSVAVDATVGIHPRVSVPERGRYDVRVTLPGHPQHLVLRCPADG